MRKKELTPAKLHAAGWVYGTSACYVSHFPRAVGGTTRARAQFANAHPHAVSAGVGVRLSPTESAWPPAYEKCTPLVHCRASNNTCLYPCKTRTSQHNPHRYVISLLLASTPAALVATRGEWRKEREEDGGGAQQFRRRRA
jgi:hypothetical protein